MLNSMNNGSVEQQGQVECRTSGITGVWSWGNKGNMVEQKYLGRVVDQEDQLKGSVFFN